MRHRLAPDRRRSRHAARRAWIAWSVTCALLSSGTGAGAQGAPPADRVPEPPTALTQPELVARLRQFADSLTRRDRFSGVVLLAQNGSSVFEQAFGLADREAKRANTVRTTFNVSSVGKLFTQIAVAQLTAQGKLSPDSTIRTYWPDYPDSIAARKVTIRQLLTHRSGITGDIFLNPLTRRSNHDLVALVTHTPLAFEPGTRQQYSNAGYVVLGEIVERVSRENYHSYIANHVFKPAGMTATGFPAIDSLPPNSAIGYTHGVDEDAPPPEPLPPLKRNGDVQPRRGSAAGGSYSNVADLFRFMMARRNGTLGAPPRRGQEMVAGGSPGSNAMVAEGLPDGYDLIVLSNFDPPAAGAIADAVEGWLGGRRGGPGDVRVGGPRIVVRRGPGGAGDGPPPDAAQGPMLPTLPDTPAGRVAGEYLRAFASGDTAVMRTFIGTRMAPNGLTLDERVGRYSEMFTENGALTLTGARSATPNDVSMAVSGARSGPMTMTMTVEAAAPYRVTGIRILMER